MQVSELLVDCGSGGGIDEDECVFVSDDVLEERRVKMKKNTSTSIIVFVFVFLFFDIHPHASPL
jgi:hypothetical protein